MNDEGRGFLPTLTYLLHLSLSLSSKAQSLQFLLPSSGSSVMQLITLLDMNPWHGLPRNPSSYLTYAAGTFRRGGDTVHFHLCFLPLITHRCYTSLPLPSLFLFSLSLSLLSLMFSLLWSALKPNPQTIAYKSVLIVLFIHPLAKSFMDLGFEVNGRKEVKEIEKR